MESLPFQIETLPHLRELRLAQNGLTWITEDIGQARDHLHILDLYDNKLDLVGAEPLKDLDQLEELDLGQNDLSLDEIHRFLPDYLVLETQLRQRRDFSTSRTKIPESIFRTDDDPVSNDGIDFSKRANEDPLSFPDEEFSGGFSNGGFSNDESPQEEVQIESTEEEEVWSIQSSTSKKPKTYPWSNSIQNSSVSSGLDGDDESWSGCVDIVKNEKKKKNIQYNFENMSQYIRGTNMFCPSDLHPPSIQMRGVLQVSKSFSTGPSLDR